MYVPGERDGSLFPAYFCREFGREYFPVWDQTASHGGIESRLIEEREHDDEDVIHGYFMPDEHAAFDANALESYSKLWVDHSKAAPRLKSSHRRFVPRAIRVSASGALAEAGLGGWLVPGNFRFCLACGASPATAGRDRARLLSLSGEGRSSATTMLTIAPLRYLYEHGEGIREDARKLLAFTDNRQDASLRRGISTT